MICEERQMGKSRRLGGENVQLYVKTIGACCIMAASLLMGMQIDKGMKHKCILLREMYDLLAFLEKEMTFHRSPVPEALQNAAQQCTTELSDVLKETASGTVRREGKVFADIWRNALEQCIPPQILTEEEKSAFREAADADTIMQRTMLQKHAERFKNMYQRELERYQEKSALTRRLSTSAGIFLIIVLL